MLIGSLLDLLAVDLNDAAPGHAFTTWSKEQLGAYLEEAVQLAFLERPDLFLEERVLKVEPCSIRQEVECCTRIRRVLGQCTADGRVTHMLRPRKLDVRLVWTGRTCPVSPKNFRLSQYAIDDTDDSIWLWPQVPAGVDVYVRVQCAVMPTEVDDDYDVPTELQAAVLQWALYRAKVVDAEVNQAVAQIAGDHKQTFWQLLRASADVAPIGEEVDRAQPTTARGVPGGTQSTG